MQDQTDIRKRGKKIERRTEKEKTRLTRGGRRRRKVNEERAKRGRPDGELSNVGTPLNYRY